MNSFQKKLLGVLIAGVCGLFYSAMHVAQAIVHNYAENDAAQYAASKTGGFKDCQDLFPNQSPPQLQSIKVGRELCFDDFAVLYSAQTKTPVYAVERLTKDRLLAARSEQRTNKFYEEARLPFADRALLNDYKSSGYDRGHNAPAADRSTDAAMAQSFSLANMVPQDPNHNRKTWSDYEKNVRKYAMRANGDVYVFTGPYFYPGENHKAIGYSKVWVPDVMWKVVYTPSSGKAFVYWSANASNVRVEPPISYDEFKKRTGLALF